MQEQVEIVRAGVEAVDELEPLWRSFAEGQHRAGRGMWPPLDVEESWRRARERHADRLGSGAFLLLARRGGALVGYALVSVATRVSATWVLDRPQASLEYIAVSPAVQGQGIGGALLARMEDELREAGVDRVSLHSLAGNSDAQDWYARHGFATFEVGMTKRLLRQLAQVVVRMSARPEQAARP